MVTRIFLIQLQEFQRKSLKKEGKKKHKLKSINLFHFSSTKNKELKNIKIFK